ncbi:U-box domain-containing protein [Stachybotrys elegans]|uniref:U-box domain-containing protein n=1 Tax=Stachybotrys elegans TaxID=80388 RepID=A0A8K0WN90_9HYPO|nr:U-box domain-containing protein [Stachybotrys elegans]
MRVPISNIGSGLPLRQKDDSPDHSGARVSLSLEPVPNSETLIVNVIPPREPLLPSSKVPSDIVLVIDVSGSMGSLATVPGDNADESTGLSCLDLVKHAANTIIEGLDVKDRLGIVTFDSRARIVLPLQQMDSDNKDLARKKIQRMTPGTSTNLWHGILDGLKTFSRAGASSNVASMMILTDGMPNHMCPPAGYIPKLRAMMPFPTTINTFGFGYSLDSGLLKAIAEIGGGSYAFIPDAGMVGTVFVHAVAHIQATYATNAAVTLMYPDSVHLEYGMGTSVDHTPPTQVVEDGRTYTTLTLPLGNLQYGHSRNIVLRTRDVSSLATNGDLHDEDASIVHACLTFDPAAAESQRSAKTRNVFFSSISSSPPSTQVDTSVTTSRSLRDTTSMPADVLAYHESRARICDYISGLFPHTGGDGQPGDQRRRPTNDLASAQEDLKQLLANIPAKGFTDALNRSLMQDLIGNGTDGQIYIAINNETYYRTWGVHYLPSYLNAHTRQICNSFKDVGPLQYGTDSPIFIACRDRLDTAFDQLPAPEPSLQQRGSYVNNHYFSMRSYNSSAAPCFAGSVPVELASGRTVPIRKLRRGVKVRTPLGPRRVALVLRTPVVDTLLCRLSDDLLVTPWHPVSSDGGKTWDFPAQINERAPVKYSGSVYSVLLERDRQSAAHAIHVADAWGVTLGHGVLAGSDVRAHQFLGDYNSVGKSLMQLRPDAKGVVVGGGVKRSPSGLINGFKEWV